jgi:hypothetical protein
MGEERREQGPRFQEVFGNPDLLAFFRVPAAQQFQQQKKKREKRQKHVVEGERYADFRSTYGYLPLWHVQRNWTQGAKFCQWAAASAANRGEIQSLEWMRGAGVEWDARAQQQQLGFISAPCSGCGPTSIHHAPGTNTHAAMQPVMATSQCFSGRSRTHLAPGTSKFVAQGLSAVSQLFWSSLTAAKSDVFL